MRVRTVPTQPHCFLYGGLDMQMNRTHEVLRSVGIDARPLDWWSRDEQFEILHIWGLSPQHHNLVRVAKSYGKKVVLTALLPYATPKSRLRHYAGIVTGRRRLAMDIVKHVDMLLAVNKLQADAAMKIFGFPSSSIEIIPTILDPLFFNTSATVAPFCRFENYVVCSGNIWPRKNQVRLARAALQAGCSMVFVGNEMGGEHAYAEELQRIVDANPSLEWYKSLSWEDLYRVLLHASAVALPSFEEYQPASCLEAVALQKPLLMANEPYARQEFFTGALTVDANSERSIADGLLRLMADPEKYTPKRELVNDCQADLVGPKLRSIFERLIS